MSKALTIVDVFNLPTSTHLGQAFMEELDGLEFSFDRVKIPSGGGLAFEVPGDDADTPETATELIGVIVDHHPVNAYWRDRYDGQNNPPDCASLDGKTGQGQPGGTCLTCPMNQWGSGDGGRSKACKNMHRIYLMREGELFPLLLTLPPTSLRNLANYLAKRVVGKGKRSHEVITKITLKKAKSAGGIPYSQAQFAFGGSLAPELANTAATLSEQFKAFTRAIDIMSDDYIVEPTTSDSNIYDDADEYDDGDMPF